MFYDSDNDPGSQGSRLTFFTTVPKLSRKKHSNCSETILNFLEIKMFFIKIFFVLIYNC